MRLARRDGRCRARTMSTEAPSASPARAPGEWRSPTPRLRPAATSCLWGRDPERMRELEATRLSDKLPGVRLADPGRRRPPTSATRRLRAPSWSPLPAQATRETAARLAGLPGSAPLVRLRQGHRARHARLHDRDPAEAAPDRPAAILSGPSFAADVAAGLPTAVTLACARRGRRALALPAPPRAEPSALSLDRRSGRRDRRRGEERARHRLRRRRRAAGSARARGARSSRAASPNCAASARPSARGARR